MRSIDGDWVATADGCMACFGYTATWKVTIVDENNIIVKEQPGSKCCGCVPNCFLKTHEMQKKGENQYAGRLCGKPIGLTQESDTVCRHFTTDGPMKMTRD